MLSQAFPTPPEQKTEQQQSRSAHKPYFYTPVKLLRYDPQQNTTSSSRAAFLRKNRNLDLWFSGLQSHRSELCLFLNNNKKHQQMDSVDFNKHLSLCVKD